MNGAIKRRIKWSCVVICIKKIFPQEVNIRVADIRNDGEIDRSSAPNFLMSISYIRKDFGIELGADLACLVTPPESCLESEVVIENSIPEIDPTGSRKCGKLAG